MALEVDDLEAEDTTGEQLLLGMIFHSTVYFLSLVSYFICSRLWSAAEGAYRAHLGSRDRHSLVEVPVGDVSYRSRLVAQQRQA